MVVFNTIVYRLERGERESKFRVFGIKERVKEGRKERGKEKGRERGRNREGNRERWEREREG